MKKVAFLMVGVYLFAAQVALSTKEKHFISSHTFKCVTTTSWAPFNTVKNGEISGISYDYWKLIKQTLHLKSICVTLPSWPKVIYAIKNKYADLTIGTEKTDKRKNYAIFSKPYAAFPIAIATRNNIGFIDSMHFLKNKKIVVGKKYTVASLLMKHYPDLKIYQVKNIKTALEMVSSGKAYAAIDIMPVLIYNINKYQFANLKIAGKTPLKFNLRFMIRKDYPLLRNAINKAINTITPKQKKEIYKKWINVNYQEGFSLKEILIIIAASGIIILLFIFWIYLLKKEIKHRKKIETELQKLSVMDSLTGLYNRYKIEQILKKEISFAKRHKFPLSVIFYDIDDFKKINDNFGHKVGDETLQELAKVVTSNIREYDFLGRWGGEEFIILLPNTDIHQAKRVAEKIRAVIQNHPFTHITRLTCSFGVTQLRQNDTSDSLIIRVDSNMYKAKKRGKNSVMSDFD